MKTFTKLLVFFSIIGIPIYYAFKYFMKFKEVMKLEETLPDYVNDVLNEKPLVFCSYTPFGFEIRMGLTKEAQERETNLVKVINDYITDFYPILDQLEKKIIIFQTDDASKT